jgi:regulator of protease activity HflC (stomatin/prohibitin superfamily)
MRQTNMTQNWQSWMTYGPRAAGVGAGAPLGRGRRLTVERWEQALLFRDGALVETLGPGSHRRWRKRITVRRVDTRPWVLTVPTQEVPTADGAPVKVTAAGRAAVVDPVAFVTAVQDVHGALYLAVQVALREVLSGHTVEELLAGRAALGGELTSAVRGLQELGVAVALELKDIVLPSDLKRAQSEVLVARAQGLAALERARGETAALRSLANAARLAEGSPALLQLRLLQQLAATPGHTVVIGTPPLGTVAAATAPGS